MGNNAMQGPSDEGPTVAWIRDHPEVLEGVERERYEDRLDAAKDRTDDYQN